MKKYNYKNIRNIVYNIVKNACYSQDNHFTHTAWDFHILPVSKISIKLGKKLKADLEVLELAGLLHDYADIKDRDLYEEHHIHGAKLAEEILSKTDFPEEKIKQIQECIFSHRGSKKIKHKSLESKILASADAMAHFTEFIDMTYLTFGIHKYKTVEGSIWLKNKLLRSWKKIIPEGKEIVKEDYEIAIKLLNKTITKKHE